jgi:methylated-DNA-protein-cysteine methyltransferase-like protein
MTAKPRPRKPRLGKPKPSVAANSRQQILATIREIPPGKVSTYGAIAKAAGLPRGARLVARTLHGSFGLPWHRVLGAGGEIKLRGDSAIEQRLRLEAESVIFRGRRVDMRRHEFKFPARRPPQISGQRKLSRYKN